MTEPLEFAGPIAECEAVVQARRIAERLARTHLPLVLAGEPGTGRTTLATAASKLRAQSGRRVTCVSGLDGLSAESRSARDSILLVRDVDALSHADQKWLAQAISEQVIVVATAKQDSVLAPLLANEISAGIVRLPPLRERGDDGMAWLRLFLAIAARTQGVDVPEISDQAQLAVRLHAWPGNLHELKQKAERAVALLEGPEILPEHLGLVGSALESVVMPLEEAMADFKRRYVQQVLDRCGGNRTQAARMLKVDPRTIFRFLESRRQ